MTSILSDVELSALNGIPAGPPRDWAHTWAICAKLDPESARQDIEARAVNPIWKHGFLERSLKPVYLYSLATADGGKAGQVSCWAPFTAAKALSAINARGVASHRLASKEEAEGWEAQQARQRSELAKLANSERASAEILAAALLAGR